MAFNDDAVKAKLSALNETQESIVTVAQWVMFHRRHAERTATLWLQKLKDSSSNKRLNLIYLANEVVQQSKARKKEDFLVAFSPIIAEATAVAYRGASTEVQAKLRRSVEVWRIRQIFELPIQQAIETRMDDLDKSRSSNKKPALGGSLFSAPATSTIPTELAPLVPLQNAATKDSALSAGTTPTAITEYEALTAPDKPTPSPPVYAARLSAVLKSLVNAETAVADSLKSRRALVEALEKILASNRAALTSQEQEHESLSEKRTQIAAKKREVEDDILRGLTHETAASTTLSGDSDLALDAHQNRNDTLNIEPKEPERPDIEELTPPPESHAETSTASNGAGTAEETALPAPSDAFPNDESIGTIPALPMTASPPPANQVGADLLSSLSLPSVRPFSGSPTNGTAGGLLKKRRVDDESAVFSGTGEDAMAGLDDDVADLLREESDARQI